MPRGTVASRLILAFAAALAIYALFPPLNLRTIGTLFFVTPYVILASCARVGNLVRLATALAAICALGHAALVLISSDFPASRGLLGSSLYVVIASLAIGVPWLAVGVGLVAKARSLRRARLAPDLSAFDWMGCVGCAAPRGCGHRPPSCYSLPIGTPPRPPLAWGRRGRFGRVLAAVTVAAHLR
jgi:hypothetical protein